MPFTSGRVTFLRFKVIGDGPVAVDEAALSILAEHKFQEVEIGAPDETEAGFVTGQHILDTQFTYEKCGYGNMLLFALRMDTHKVPSEYKQAYKMINEQAAAAGNPSGFASKSDKREAKELAERQVHEDLAAGKFRKSKMFPILWDLKAGMIYLGGASNSVIEELARQMRHAFAVDLECMSSGLSAGFYLRENHSSRDYEDFRPSKFTKPPAVAAMNRDESEIGGYDDLATPIVPWVSKSVDLKDFLGNEFLYYLLYLAETNEGLCEVEDANEKREYFITIDKALDMDCAWDAGGKQTLRGNAPDRLPEAAEAMVTGKWPRKLGLLLSDGELSYELMLQGDKYIVSGAQLPEIQDAETPREIIEYRLSYIAKLAEIVDDMYHGFIAVRSDTAKWPGLRDKMSKWIRTRKAPKVAVPMKTPPSSEQVSGSQQAEEPETAEV
ncbi:hypothetical protein [Poriferisphaera sp. WC338]|uniref:hypothetical protein n=1 Tax=Poriferisphaera sp. WC338 TaxID=3425129 RepID=UPI003D81B3FD